jgi:hypothetical protein
MIKRFENIFLDNTSNEKIEDDEGQCGTLRVNDDYTLAIYSYKDKSGIDQELRIPIISYIGDFENPACDEMWIRDASNYSDYTFVRNYVELKE